MADVFAVGLHAFPFDETTLPSSRLLGNHGANATEHLATEIGGGPLGLLNLLSVIGTSLSIVGVVLAFITYSLFSDLRTMSGTSLLNLLTALFLSHLLSIIGVERTHDHSLCLTLAVLLHYLWLSLHTWLTAMAYDMHRTFRDNINLQPSLIEEDRKSFVRCALFAWGTPAICTGLAVWIHLKVDDGIPIADTCWVIGRRALYYCFLLPAFLLALLDVHFFIQSAILTRYTASLQINRRTRGKMKRRRYLQLFLYVKVLVMLMAVCCCSWLSQITGSIVFWYAFVILASTQGFLIALFYSCNSQVFRMYSKSLRSSHSSKPAAYGSSEISCSTSLTMLTWQPTPDAV